MAVDRGLEIDLADALGRASEEGVDGDQASGVRRFDVALAELRREPRDTNANGTGSAALSPDLS